MKKISLILLLTFAFFIKAQPPTAFYTRFGGPGIDIAYSVKETLDKEYIIAGGTSSYGNGATDMYLAKFDTMGQVIWSKTFGGFNSETAKAVVQLSDSGYVVTGFSNSYGAGGYDAITIRTDKNGNQLWLKTWGGSDWDFANDVLIGSDGNIVICGKTRSFGKGGEDGFVVKYDLSGNIVWQKTFGGTSDDDFKSIYSKNGSDYFVAGTTRSYGEINGDLYCFKLDNNGDSLMRIIYGGSLYDGGNVVIVNNSNEIIIGGGSNSFTSGKMDALFAKFSSTGSFMWNQNFGLAGDDEEVRGIVLSAAPVLGECVAMYSTFEVANYKSDVKTIFMNSGGLWFGGYGSGSFGSSGEDEVYSICTTKDKGYVQVGYTTGFGAQDKDFFLIKRDSLLGFGTSIVGVKSLTKNNSNQIRVYPNPVKEQENIYIATGNQLSTSVTVINSVGRELQAFQFNENNNLGFYLPFDKFEPGIYFIRIAQNENVYIRKIIKQ